MGIFLWSWAMTPPRKQKAWWWRQFSEGTIVSHSTTSDQAIFCFLIYVSVTCQGIWKEAVDHLTIAMPLNLNSAISFILMLSRLRRQHRRDGATATLAPQVAGDS
jgi:hypothetical protein